MKRLIFLTTMVAILIGFMVKDMVGESPPSIPLFLVACSLLWCANIIGWISDSLARNNNV